MSIRDRTETTLSEINVTPLVDVMLVLLIIFMVTAPMMSTSVDVRLAQATTALPAKAREHLIVTVTSAGRIYVADTSTELESVSSTVRAELRRSGLEDVAIRGDKTVPYGTVLAVLDRLRAAEVKNVGLVMDPPSEETGSSP